MSELPSSNFPATTKRDDVASPPSLFKQLYVTEQPKTPASTLGDSTETMFLQPTTCPITEEQLANEIRGIYSGLVMV